MEVTRRKKSKKKKTNQMKCNLLLQLYIVYSKNSAEYEENEENKTKVKSFNTLRGIIDIEAKKWR